MLKIRYIKKCVKVSHNLNHFDLGDTVLFLLNSMLHGVLIALSSSLKLGLDSDLARVNVKREAAVCNISKVGVCICCEFH